MLSGSGLRRLSVRELPVGLAVEHKQLTEKGETETTLLDYPVPASGLATWASGSGCMRFGESDGPSWILALDQLVGRRGDQDEDGLQKVTPFSRECERGLRHQLELVRVGSALRKLKIRLSLLNPGESGGVFGLAARVLHDLACSGERGVNIHCVDQSGQALNTPSVIGGGSSGEGPTGSLNVIVKNDLTTPRGGIGYLTFPEGYWVESHREAVWE